MNFILFDSTAFYVKSEPDREKYGSADPAANNICPISPIPGSD